MPRPVAAEVISSLAVPPPRATHDLVGHRRAEAAFATAFHAGKLPHGWLITGPEGIGKATFAYRIARFLLSEPRFRTSDPESLAVDPSSPVSHQIAEGVTQDLLVIERPTDEKKGTLKAVIPVEAARQVSGFFALRSGAGGYRVAIIDALDYLNRFGQNALLKTLEEPPRKGILLLLAHNAGRVLPTIRSRCRQIALGPVEEGALRGFLEAKTAEIELDLPNEEDTRLLAALAGGAPGWALTLLASGGLPLFKGLMGYAAAWPNARDREVFELADAAAAAEAAHKGMPARLLRELVHHIAKTAANGAAGAHLPGGESAILHCARGAPAASWAEAWSELNEFIESAGSINVDFRQVMIEALRRLNAVKR